MSFRHWLAAAVLLIASPAAAQELTAKRAFCDSCHGTEGRPHDNDVPIIWGQQSAYLAKQLRDYRAGDRDNQIMSSIAESLSDADIAALAEAFARLPWPTTPPGAAAQTCDACHKVPDIAGIPRLAGQQPAYLQATMEDYDNGTRANSTLMTGLMKGLTADQRAALAAAIGTP